MKKIILLMLAGVIFSCSKKAETHDDSGVKPDSIVAKTDSVAVQKVGADEDLHGCKSSAGYTWSELRQECVRIFEAGTRLDAQQKDAISVFVIFEKNGNRAELFTLLESKPVMLERKAEGQPWTSGDWELIPWKGYVLKKKGAILFTGK